jgi:hypothetical protein
LGWHPVAVVQYTFTHKQYKQYIRTYRQTDMTKLTVVFCNCFVQAPKNASAVVASPRWSADSCAPALHSCSRNETGIEEPSAILSYALGGLVIASGEQGLFASVRPAIHKDGTTAKYLQHTDATRLPGMKTSSGLKQPMPLPTNMTHIYRHTGPEGYMLTRQSFTLEKFICSLMGVNKSRTVRVPASLTLKPHDGFKLNWTQRVINIHILRWIKVVKYLSILTPNVLARVLCPWTVHRFLELYNINNTCSISKGPLGFVTLRQASF